MKKALMSMVAFWGILFFSYSASAQIFAKHYIGGSIEVSAVVPADMVLLDLDFKLGGSFYCLIEGSGQASVNLDENVFQLCIDVDRLGPITSTCRDVVIHTPFYTSWVQSLRRGTHNVRLLGSKRFSSGVVQLDEVTITVICEKRGSVEYAESPSVK